MNYFTHAIRFLDRPWFAAGTAVPDWLSVIDRQVRVHSKTLEPMLATFGSPEEREIAEGILQHLHDDQWFHATPGFAIATSRLTVAFRETTPDPDFPASFLGHVVMELLLDAALRARHPELMGQYYDVLERVDPHLVESVVNRASRNPTDRLSKLIPLYIQERFLEDYSDPTRLLRRLNQVMRRVKLPGLPDAVLPVLHKGADIVEEHFDELLPSDLFPWPEPALRTLR
jgi:hypothetical protein